MKKLALFKILFCLPLLILFLSSCNLSRQALRDRFMASGKKLMEKKDYRRAALDFRNALKASPRDAEVYYQLAMADLGIPDVGEGVAALKNALVINPKHPGAQLRLAQLLASTADPNFLADANKRLVTLLNETPEDPGALNTLALTELKLGKVQDGMQHLSRILQKYPKQFSTSLLLAQAMWAQHDTKGAEDVLIKAADTDPKSPAPIVALSSLYAGMNQLAEAENQLHRALQLDPKNGPALASLGLIQRQLGRNQEAEVTFRTLSNFSELDYKPMLGLFLFEQGRRDEALAEFQRLANADPSDRMARTRLVAIYRTMNRTPEAEKILSAALKKNPTDLDALLQRSELYIEAKSYDKAEADLYQVLHYRPTSGEAHYTLSRIRQLQGAGLTQRQELGEAVRLNPYLVAARVELARLLILANDGKAAVETLDEAPAAQKALPVLIVQRNWALWSANKMADMRKGIDQGLAIQRSAELLIQDGMWKLRSGDFAHAKAALEEALQLNPSDYRALEVLRQTYLAQKQPSIAIQKVKEYAAKSSKSAPVQQFLGNLLMVQGDLKEARTALVTANNNDPNFIPAYLSLVQVDVAEHKLDDAASRLQKVLSLNSRHLTARLWLGNIEATKGNLAEALKYYREVTAADPGNSQALNNVAYLTSEFANQPNDALQYAQKAQELDPKNLEFADTFGWILYRKGLYSSSVKSLERTASGEGNVIWQYHLAMAYAKAGDVKRGRVLLDAALKRNPNIPEAKMARQVLESAIAR